MRMNNSVSRFPFRFKRASAKSRIGDNPDAYWKVAVSLFLAAILVVLILHLYFFLKIKNGTLFSLDVLDEPPGLAGINREELSSIVGKYEEKQKKFSNLERTGSRSVDPSL